MTRTAAGMFLAVLLTMGCGGITSPYMVRPQSPPAVMIEPNSATVFFVRPSDYGGGMKNIIIDERGRFLGECWGQTYFVVKVPPGEHLFISWGEATPAIRATLNPGMVYFVEVGITMGVWTARSRLLAMGPQRKNWDKIPQWLAESAPLVPNEAAGQAYLAERRQDVQELIQKGMASYAGYDAEGIQQRTLLPTDGVTSPLPPR